MIRKIYKIKKVSYQTYAGEVQSVRGVSFEVNEGETLGLVGESCCGKTTCGRTVMGLYPATGGEIILKVQI